MSTDEFTKNEDFINQQMASGKILSKAEAEKRLQAGDLVWVDSYTRDDGTEVKGYYRTKPGRI